MLYTVRANPAFRSLVVAGNSSSASVDRDVGCAKKPVQNVSGKRHPNLAAAQRLSANAYQKIIAAQQANEWDLEGHAQKAKDLLDQANQELKQAAQASNANHK